MKISKNIFLIISIIFFQNQFKINICEAIETIQLYTEEKPPNNFLGKKKKNEITGIATEIVEKIFKISNINYNIEIIPWARGYDLTLKNKNIGLYSAARTPEREKLFKWVGPLVDNNWVFLAKKNSKIKIKNILEAKKYRIGVYNKSALTDFLIQNGFSKSQNLEITYDDNLNPLKLENNRINLWAINNNAGKYIANKLNLKVKKIYSIKNVKMYLIFNKDTDDIIIKNLSKSLEKIRKEGYISNKLKKYNLKE